MTETETLLQELIALRSVNPAFLPEGHPDAGESRVAKFLGATARKAGLDVEFQQVTPGRSNVIARLSPERESQETHPVRCRIWTRFQLRPKRNFFRAFQMADSTDAARAIRKVPSLRCSLR